MGTHRILLDSDQEFDHLIHFIEAGFEDAHEGTVDRELDQEEREDCSKHLFSARMLLKRLCPESEILGLGIKAGVFFDWEEYHESEMDDDEMDEVDEEETPVAQEQESEIGSPASK